MINDSGELGRAKAALQKQKQELSRLGSESGEFRAMLTELRAHLAVAIATAEKDIAAFETNERRRMDEEQRRTLNALNKKEL